MPRTGWPIRMNSPAGSAVQFEHVMQRRSEDAVDAHQGIER